MTTMTMQAPNDALDLDTLPDDTLMRAEQSAVAVFARSEIESQLDAAHRYPRSVQRFMKEAVGLACLTRPVAESCIYALPRGGKVISGPSVRLAEICASAYGNLHVAARVLGAEDREVVAQGVAWDLEKNLRVTVEARRRITNKKGVRFDDDMITMTGNAAGSIALRNAIFRVVPRAYIDAIYAKVREVAVGNASTLAGRRAEVVERLQKIGVPIERIFPRVEKIGIDDVGLAELEVLIGLGTAIKDGKMPIDEAFPPLPGPATGAKKLQDDLLATPPPAKEPKPARAPKPPTPPPMNSVADSLPVSPPPPPVAAAPVAPPAREAGDDSEDVAKEREEAERALSAKDAPSERDPAMPDWLSKPLAPAEQAAADNVARARQQAERGEKKA